jgi:Leu/Phe-tRNA-protein transferase
MSPPILQANETGVLLMAYDNEDEKFVFVRSRKVIPALGFEPMLRLREFTRERDALKSLAKHEDVIHEVDEDNDNENSEVDKSVKEGATSLYEFYL